MSEAGEIKYKITGDDNGLKASLDNAKRQAEQTAASMAAASDSIEQVGTNAAAAATALSSTASAAARAAENTSQAAAGAEKWGLPYQRLPEALLPLPTAHRHLCRGLLPRWGRCPRRLRALCVTLTMWAMQLRTLVKKARKQEKGRKRSGKDRLCGGQSGTGDRQDISCGCGCCICGGSGCFQGGY